MYKFSAAVAAAVLLTMSAFAQTPAPAGGAFGAFEASVLAGLDRQVDAQKETLAALRARLSENHPEVEAAMLNLALLQAKRDALAMTNAEIANRRVAVMLDPGLLTGSRADQPAAHDSLFDFSKSEVVTGTITQLNFSSPYSVLTVNVSGVLRNVFLASTNALAAAGWNRGTVRIGDQISVAGSPARARANILQATQVSAGGRTLFSRPDAELTREAAGVYEK